MSFPANPRLLEYDQGLGSETAASFSQVTLRDLFAAAALAGVMASPSDVGHLRALPDGEVVGHFAQIAYRLADAMLAEREKGRS